MVYSIKNGVLQSGGANVPQVRSRNTGGAFAQPPEIVVIHFTAGGSAASSAAWFASKDNTNSSAHVVIERDGGIIQCVPFNVVAWHAGKSTWRNGAGQVLNGLNRYALGIEIANWGALHGANGAWLNGAGQVVANPFMGVHRNGNPDGSRIPIGWEAYPEPQMQAVIALVRALAQTYPIKEIVGHDDIAPLRKSDPGPAFNMARLRDAVFGGRKDDGANVAHVDVAGGLNLRAGAGQSFAVIELLADETALEPISRDGQWIEVAVLDKKGRPRVTGWVHGKFVRMD